MNGLYYSFVDGYMYQFQFFMTKAAMGISLFVDPLDKETYGEGVTQVGLFSCKSVPKFQLCAGKTFFLKTLKFSIKSSASMNAKHNGFKAVERTMTHVLIHKYSYQTFFPFHSILTQPTLCAYCV